MPSGAVGAHTNAGCNLKFIMESKDQEGSHLIVIIQYTNVEIQCGLCEEEVPLLGILTRCEEI